MVRLGEQAILRCERGGNCHICSTDRFVLGVLGVLPIFSGYPLLQMRSCRTSCRMCMPMEGC